MHRRGFHNPGKPGSWLLAVFLLAACVTGGQLQVARSTLAEPTPLPLGVTDFQEFAPRPALAVADAIYETHDGHLAFVFEQLNADGSSGSLFWTRSQGNRQFPAPEELSLLEATVIGSASAVHSTGGDYLYFLAGGHATEGATLYRTRFLADRFSPVEEIRPPEGICNLLSWPTFHALDDGTIATVYRTQDRLLALSRSRDGLSFEPPVLLTDFPVAMPAIGQFGTGEIAVAFQTTPEEGYGKQSWLRVSSAGGEAWSEPILVTTKSKNVHDTTLARRVDGNIDLYFSQSNEAYTGGFSIFRRALEPGGQLGPIQRVTTPETGSLLKPYVIRVSDGTLLLVGSKKLDQNRRQLLIATLAGDAPAQHQPPLATGE